MSHWLYRPEQRTLITYQLIIEIILGDRIKTPSTRKSDGIRVITCLFDYFLTAGRIITNRHPFARGSNNLKRRVRKCHTRSTLKKTYSSNYFRKVLKIG